jgi:hypothetical protein
MWDPAQTGHMTAEREAEIIAAWEAKQAAALAN